MKNKLWEVKQQADPQKLEIYVYGAIEKYSWDDDDNLKIAEASQEGFRQLLEEHKDVKEIILYVNSQGGSVFEAMGMRGLLKRHPAKVTAIVDGWAASAASFLITAADRVIMDKSALQMIHNMWVVAAGNASELRRIADDLDKMMEGNRQAYLEKAGDKLSEEKLIKLMNAETWLTADECMALGLCDEIVEKAAESEAQQAGTVSLVEIPVTLSHADAISPPKETPRSAPEIPPDDNINAPEESGEEPQHSGSYFLAAFIHAVERTNQ